jgi:Fe2+ or Zn2+ uptake regulation protein
VAEISQEMARQTGYQITHHQLNFFGLCPRCQKEGQSLETKEKENGKE